MGLNTCFSEKLEAGIDEAGRGCIAGPVVAAAVVLPEGFNHPLINDSKKLSARHRDYLSEIIKEKAITYGIGIIDHETIDRINILNATFKAMNQAIRKLSVTPELLLIDGTRFRPETDIPFRCIVKGDSTYLSIAAASILAKTFRDKIMENLDNEYPVYKWRKNKGYPTMEHRKAILQAGISCYHRKSFQLLLNEKQLKLPF